MKKIGGVKYIHWTAYKQLNKEELDLVMKAKNICRVGFDKCEIYKIDMKNKKVSFIESEDFDTAREPEVGKSWVIDVVEKTIKEIKPKGQIYHHKWMFVEDNYGWFDVEESKRWSAKWQAVIPQNRIVKSRIGYKKYWNEYLEQYGLEIEK